MVNVAEKTARGAPACLMWFTYVKGRAQTALAFSSKAFFYGSSSWKFEGLNLRSARVKNVTVHRAENEGMFRVV